MDTDGFNLDGTQSFVQYRLALNALSLSLRDSYVRFPYRIKHALKVFQYSLQGQPKRYRHRYTLTRVGIHDGEQPVASCP